MTYILLSALHRS